MRRAEWPGLVVLGIAVLAPSTVWGQPSGPGLAPPLEPQLSSLTLPAPNLPGTPAPVLPRLATRLHAAHQAVPVPPTLEIEVLDPNVDPRGNPAIVPRPVGVCTPSGPEGRLAVDIPPTVLVHRYYYTGDRSFQGPLLAGGPSIVVANHPRTGERLYIPVQLLPGAPRVTYTAHTIRYDYGQQAITIHFGWLCGPKVVYRQGVPLTEKIQKGVARTGEATRRLIDRTGIPECHDQFIGATRNVVETTADRVNDLGKALVAPPLAIIRRTPLANLVTSSPEDRAARERDAEVNRAQADALRQGSTINTNR